MTFNDWTTDLADNEDAFFDDLERIKSRAFNENGWLYIESDLYFSLEALVKKYDPLTKKHIKETTEMLMQHLLGDKYTSKTHKPSIGDLAPKPKRKQKQKKQTAITIDSRKCTRTIFIPKP